MKPGVWPVAVKFPGVEPEQINWVEGETVDADGEPEQTKGGEKVSVVPEGGATVEL